MDNKLSNSLNLSLVLCLYLYPITSCVVYLFELNSSILNIVFKAFTFVIYFICFYRVVFYKNKLYILNISLFLLLIIYSFRLLVDVFIYDIQHELYSSSYLLLYFFLLTFLPVHNFIKSGYHFNISKFIKYSGVLLIVINLLYFFVAIKDGSSFADLFSSRINKVAEDENISVINPIIVGLNGCVIVLYSLYNYLFNSKYSFLNIIMIFLGLFNLAVGASRGPLFITILLTFFMLLIFFRSKKQGFKTFFSFVTIIFITIFIILPFVDKYDFFLFNRIESFFLFEEEIRNIIIDNAMTDFLNNPVFGLHIFDSTSNAFPHNILVDALMSCGFLGGILVVFSFIPFFKNSFKLMLNKKNYEYGFLFFILSPFIIIGFTSGSFLFFPEFWVALSLLSIKLNRFYK